MMKSLAPILGLLALLVPCNCLKSNEYCGDGVQTAVSSFTFTGTEDDDYWGNVCTNELGYKSLGAGVKSYCSSSEITPSWQLLESYCSEYGLVSLPLWSELLPNLTDDVIRSMQLVEFTDIDESVVWNNSVLISKDLWEASVRTTV